MKHSVDEITHNKIKVYKSYGYINKFTGEIHRFSYRLTIPQIKNRHLKRDERYDKFVYYPVKIKFPENC